MPIPTPLLANIARKHGTPCWVYDADTVRAQIEKLRRFDVIRFAQKANANLALLRLMKKAGVFVDAVSLGELERALAAGFDPQDPRAPIVYTADLLDRATLARVVELRVPVNVGSPQMLEQLGQHSRGHAVWLRVNPGFGHGHSKKTNTGGEHSKHGIWHELLHESLALVERYGLSLRGLHMHIGSGVDYTHLQRVCDAMVSTVKTHGQDVHAISAGGGLSVPYRPGDTQVDTDHYFELWDSARREIEGIVQHKVTLEIEPGRFLVAQAGFLISEVRAHKRMGSNQFLLVDAGFNDLMRPALYGAYHAVSVLDPEGAPRTGPLQQVIVAGPLCESGDVFTQLAGGEVEARSLPEARVGDWVVFHDAGAYGASMSSNYNSRPLLPEVLVDGEAVQLVRRRQTIADLLSLES